jgi:hypothetical protein
MTHSKPPFEALSDEQLGQSLHKALHELPDAPVALQRAAIALWPLDRSTAAATTAAALGALVQGVGQRIWGALSFDSWAAPALAPGMRSLRSSTRQLLFSAQGRDIDLRVTASGASFSLAGQLLGPDESGMVEIARLNANDDDGQLRQVAPLDALGEFRIDGVQHGVYVVTLQLSGEQIVLSPVAVGEPVA